MEILRHPEYGCEWDRVQTHLSVRKDFIEETYEAVDAIDNNDKELMLEEFGDVMLQVLLHCQMEKEEGGFAFEDVVNAMTKMAVFYKDMVQGHFEQVNHKVESRFLSLSAELGDESKIHFVFYGLAILF